MIAGKISLSAPLLKSPFSVASVGSIRTLIGVRYVPVSRKGMRRDSRPVYREGVTKINYNKPTLDVASEMPLSPQEMDNSTLVSLGAMGDHNARREILKRHIMAVDRISYDEAEVIYGKIKAKNQEGMFLLNLPYQIGIATSVTAGIASLPLVFHFDTASWFNHHFVTTQVPDPEDLETMLEVGSWAWNWMEPPLGTISFVLLAFQFSRAQLQNLGIRPYTESVKLWRGKRLASAFRQYNAQVLIKYSETSSFYNP